MKRGVGLSTFYVFMLKLITESAAINKSTRLNLLFMEMTKGLKFQEGAGQK
jgi:hypothetical protein